MRPIMMGAVSSNKSSSLSLVSSGTALHEELERMAALENGNEDVYDEECDEEMTTERQKEIAMREQIAETLLRKSSSHLLVTANSSIDHLHFIRESNNNSRGGRKSVSSSVRLDHARFNDHGGSDLRLPKESEDPNQRSKRREKNRNQNREGAGGTATAPAPPPQGAANKTDIQWIADNIKIVGISTYIEPKVTEIDESSNVVIKYQSPSFHTSANVCFPAIPAYETWKVGWLQACSSMKFINVYGRLGLTSWEFPQLNGEEQPMVSDSDGKHFPWYGDHHEINVIHGPTSKPTQFKVKMNDSFYPQVTWMPPIAVAPKDIAKAGGTKKCLLTKIQRDQTFYTWLIARNEMSKELIVLLTVTWRAQIDISIDPHAPRGQRATLFGVKTQKPPEILSHNVPIPRCAMEPPHANGAQMLMWRPFNLSKDDNDIPEVIIPPRWRGAGPPTQTQMKCPKTINMNEEMRTSISE